MTQRQVYNKVKLATKIVNEYVAPTVSDIYRKYIKDKVSIEDELDARVAIDAMIADIVEEITGMKTMIHENSAAEYPALIIDLDDDFRIVKVYLDIDEENTTILYSD